MLTHNEKIDLPKLEDAVPTLWGIHALIARDLEVHTKTDQAMELIRQAAELMGDRLTELELKRDA